jgi:hypothetical protein
MENRYEIQRIKNQWFILDMHQDGGFAIETLEDENEAKISCALWNLSHLRDTQRAAKEQR